MPSHQTLNADTKSTVAALLLYAVRRDCDASMQLLATSDRTELMLIAHTMAHILGELITEEHDGLGGAEAACQQLIAQFAGVS